MVACKQRVFNSVRAHVVFMQEPNAKEYLQLALARILELQREIKDGTYATDHTSDLGNVNLETLLHDPCERLLWFSWLGSLP